MLKHLLDITDPHFIKSLTNAQCRLLAKDIREFLITSVSQTGGHLSSNLGTVEMTIALHKVFDSPRDQLIFDVGHQAYTHKILTGRAKDFSTLRQFQGLSGFQKRSESEHDVFEAGHAGTSLSAAYGMAVARDLKEKDHHIVAVIGDGSMTNGMAYEALNHIGDSRHKVIIILNDNSMSISKNVGYLSQRFNTMRVGKPYNEFKLDLNEFLAKGGKWLEPVQKSLISIRNQVRKNVVDETIFTEFGLQYVGPFNGHHIADMVRAFEYAKSYDGGPIVVHLKTQKGKGYHLSEGDMDGSWHGVSKFDIDSGEPLERVSESRQSYSTIVSESLIRLAKEDEDIVVITPAMKKGSSLDHFFETFPKRAIDTGITEGHAATFASGLALSGKKPFLSIYSTFLQRAYDQINHDITRMNLPVVIGVDRAGLVGEDGDTHHGVFDIGILKPLPNLVIAQAKNGTELQHLLYTAFQHEGPFALRYPRGVSEYYPVPTFEHIDIGSWEILKVQPNPELIVLTYGQEVQQVYDYAKERELPLWVVNMRFIKPLDELVLNEILHLDVPILLYETDIQVGGVGDSICCYMNDIDVHHKLHRVGLHDHYVEHGSVEKLRQHEHIDLAAVAKKIDELLAK